MEVSTGVASCELKLRPEVSVGLMIKGMNIKDAVESMYSNIELTMKDMNIKDAVKSMYLNPILYICLLFLL